MSESKGVQVEVGEDGTIGFDSRVYQIATHHKYSNMDIIIGFKYDEHHFIRIIKAICYEGYADVETFMIHGPELEIIHTAHMMRKLGWVQNDGLQDDKNGVQPDANNDNDEKRETAGGDHQDAGPEDIQIGNTERGSGD